MGLESHALRSGARRAATDRSLLGAACREEPPYELSDLVAGILRPGRREHDPVLRVHQRLREDLRRPAMIYLTAAVSLFLFVYLFTALIRPEWF